MGAVVLLIIYGALIGLGGIASFARQKSKPALIAGGFASIVLTVCGALTYSGSHAAASVGLVMTVLLTALFGLRYRRKKVRPAGVMMIVSLIVAVGVGYS